MEIQFNCLRARKFSTKMRIYAVASHNLRLKKNQTNVNHEKSKYNQIIFDSLGFDRSKKEGLYNSLSAYYDDLGVKRKSGNVLMFEYAVSASPEFFRGKSPDQVLEWAEHQSKFFQEQFGQNYKVAFLHLDEKTPHLQIICSTEIKSVKKYRNRYGACEKETLSLNAKHIDSDFLILLHDKHAEWNKKYGLSRGIRGLRATYQELDDYYKNIRKIQSLDYTDQANNYLRKQLQPKSRFGWVPLNVVYNLVGRFLAKFAKQQKMLLQAKKDLDVLRRKAIADYEKRQEYKDAYIKYTTKVPGILAKIEKQDQEIAKLTLELEQAKIKARELQIAPDQQNKPKIGPARSFKFGR